MTGRQGRLEDVEAALGVWDAATRARAPRADVAATRRQVMRDRMTRTDTFLVVVEQDGAIVAMGMAMQGRGDDGAGPPIAGLWHIAAVFVAPDAWGRGVGKQVVDLLVDEGRSRGYPRAQLWTHADNLRAHRLYTGRAFVLSGREKDDESRGRIVHYERWL